MILNLKRGILLLCLGLIAAGLIASACKPGGGNSMLIPPLGSYHLEQSKTGFFIIVPRGIAQ